MIHLSFMKPNHARIEKITKGAQKRGFSYNLYGISDKISRDYGTGEQHIANYQVLDKKTICHFIIERELLYYLVGFILILTFESGWMGSRRNTSGDSSRERSL